MLPKYMLMKRLHEMFKTTTKTKTILKSATALVVCLGLATQLAPTPAQAGKTEAIIFGAIATAVVIDQAVKAEERRRHYRPVHRPRRHKQPRQVRRPVVQVNYAENMKIQTSLNTLGYDAGAVDGVIGNGTRGAIRTFQIDIDEDATGVLTPAQKAVLFDRAAREEAGVAQDQNPTVDQPDAGNDVADIQDALNELGYEAGPADGVMGQNTVEAIMEFQADYDRPETGVLTDEERTLLFAELADLEDEDDDDDDDLAEVEAGEGIDGDV